MKKIIPVLILVCIILAFFYKTVFFGKIPFPADLMLSEYVPWRHTSYFGYAPGAIPSKGQYFDVVRELYPWKTLVIDAIKQHTVPLWNTFSFSGTPLLANYQSQVFYPLASLYFVLPQIMVWTILVILQPVLGSVFLYFFATEIGLSVTAAIIAALCFNFSGFAIVWMEFNTVWHTILWLPLLLFLTERGITKKSLSFNQKLLFIFAVFSTITAGHPQDFINTFLFFSAYAIIRILTTKTLTKKEKPIFFLKEIVLPSTIGFLFALPQILPTIELFKYSSRIPHDYKHILNTMLVQWWQLPLLAISDFFGNPATRTYTLPDTYVGKTLSIGAAGFVLVCLSFWDKKKRFFISFFTTSAFILLLLNVHTIFSSIFYRFPIPLLSTGTPTRNLFILSFSLAMLSGFGVDAIRKITKKQLIISVSLVTVFFGLCKTLIFFHPTIDSISIIQPSTNRAFLLSSLIAGIMILAIIITRRFVKIRYVLILIITAELLYSFTKFNPFVPPQFIYPPNDILTFLQKNTGIHRYWGYGTGRMESNLNAQYRLFSTDGTDPLNISWYNRFIQSSNDGNIAQQFTRTTRSDVALAPGYGELDLPSNAYRLRIMDLLGVKYILDRIENPKNDQTFSSNHFKPILDTTDGYTVYENTKVLPRIFLADTIVTYKTDADFEKIFFNPAFDPLSTILLHEPSQLAKPQPTKNKSVRVISYTQNSIEIETETDAPQILFLSDTYYPDWNATINEKPTPIERADYAFRAIAVPTGKHHIVFSYHPKSFENGIIGSVIGGISVILLFIFTKRKR